MGFDRIFVFYRPEIQQLPFWEELRALPYVTLTEQPLGSPIDNYNQTGTESLCLTDNQFGAKYDWVFFADVDEYLWFDELISVKQFLQRHKHRSYLSFGKQMHSLSNRVMNTNIQNANGNSQQRQSNLANQEYISAKNTSSFAVADYPFYMKHFCLHKSRKNHPICPTWRGRAKVMVRPTVHTKINVHGTFYHNQLDHDDAKNTTDNNNSSPLVDTGGGTRIHFHPDVAHIKEWPEIFDAHTVTRRTPERFVVTSQDEVHIHNIHTGFLPLEGDEGNFLVANGQWQVEYDSDLRHWFDFVIGRPGV